MIARLLSRHPRLVQPAAWRYLASYAGSDCSLEIPDHGDLQEVKLVDGGGHQKKTSISAWGTAEKF